jgi:tripartite-type tricarboxylate transporter receptor subunit TctC
MRSVPGGALGLLIAVMISAAASPVRANPWPQAPVRIIVPFAAGSTPDGLARVLANRLQARSGQAVVVENRAGASGNTGTDAVAKAQPDGRTVGLSIVGPLVLNKLLMAAMPYETERDLAPICILAEQPSVLVSSAATDLVDFAALAARLKLEGAAQNYGSIGHGSLSHLAMALLAGQLGGQPQHVAYTSSPAVVTALIRNDVQMAVLPAGVAVPQARAGALRMLAATGGARSAMLPDVPTFAELGVATLDGSAWVGLIAPAAVSPAVREEIRSAVVAVLNEEAMQAQLAGMYLTAVGSSPDHFRDVMAQELRRWRPVIESSGIRME